MARGIARPRPDFGGGEPLSTVRPTCRRPTRANVRQPVQEVLRPRRLTAGIPEQRP